MRGGGRRKRTRTDIEMELMASALGPGWSENLGKFETSLFVVPNTGNQELELILKLILTLNATLTFNLHFDLDENC